MKETICWSEIITVTIREATLQLLDSITFLELSGIEVEKNTTGSQKQRLPFIEYF